MSTQDNLFDLIDDTSPAEDKVSTESPAESLAESAPQGANAPMEYSVSELSQKLKRVIEGQFSYVRVRGELSRVTIARSGHMYSSLKDENAVLDAICWRGALNTLSIRPEEGLDVIVTGRLTTYPGRSNYQIIIESMELAGEGALLKMLEERRRKLAAEGLFDPARKKPLPYIPERIGVITSPTGAVIRDILHRLNDRFPRPVLLLPAVVQGEHAAAQVSAGIIAFNKLPKGSPHRPDLLIVARGGGSLEDLMPFNDERVVRAIAASEIPIICAVGHETDTTLADYAADLRAPTPTGAAEKAVPVRLELISGLKQTGARLDRAVYRNLQERRTHISGLARGLTHPRHLLENMVQRLDNLSNRLDTCLSASLHHRQKQFITAASRLTLRPQREKIRHQTDRLKDFSTRLPRRLLQKLREDHKQIQNIRLDHGLIQQLRHHQHQISAIAGRLSLAPYRQRLAHQTTLLDNSAKRLDRAALQLLAERQSHLTGQTALLETLSFKNTLKRGFTVVRDDQNNPVTTARAIKSGQKLKIQFQDGDTQVISE